MQLAVVGLGNPLCWMETVASSEVSESRHRGSAIVLGPGVFQGQIGVGHFSGCFLSYSAWVIGSVLPALRGSMTVYGPWWRFHGNPLFLSGMFLTAGTPRIGVLIIRLLRTAQGVTPQSEVQLPVAGDGASTDLAIAGHSFAHH